jgi:hypothetical protein
MDAQVIAAMQKWPDVPDVYNWLRLDPRGRWRVRARDYELTRRFETISNPAVIEFIGRNYAADATGRWFFQNGPQRVFVMVDAAPWVLRMDGEALVTHTGAQVRRVEAALLDETQTPLFITDVGAGQLDDRDGERWVDSLKPLMGGRLQPSMLEEWLLDGVSGQWGFEIYGHTLPVERVRREEFSARCGFVRAPQPPAGAEDC